MRWRRWALGCCALLLASACAAPRPAPSNEASSSPPPRATPSAPAIVPAATFCGEKLLAGAKQKSLPAPDGVNLNSVWVGSGPVTAVLLHQTDGNGLCGFLFYATYLTERGVSVVALDLCNYGQSYCRQAPLTNDPAAQVQVATDAARAAGARRIVLVGASMGGSVAVTAARAAKADAIVDLSGPAVFTVSDIATDAANVTMPALFAFSRTDQSDLTAVRKALPSMPSKTKTFRSFDAGHGYELLHGSDRKVFSALAREVAGFVRG